jgi:Tfp pilus assembly protein PilV
MMCRSLRSDRGESLIELLVTIVIMGTAVVALVGGLGVAITMSDIHRKQAKAGAYVRNFAEAIETEVAKSPSGYLPCGNAAAYQAMFASPEPGSFDRAVTAVAYWNGTAFANTCTTDGGVQRISLRVSSTDGRASEALDLVIRKPCRPKARYPQDWPC